MNGRTNGAHPSPSPVAKLHVERELTFADDGEVFVEHHDYEWVGYTPDEAIARRHRGLRDAKADVTREGMTLRHRADHGEFVVVEHLTFS